MGNKEQKAYSEVLAFLKIVDEEYFNKIPQKLIDIFEKEKQKDYYPKYNLERPLDSQEFTEDTLEVIAMLYLNYWCENEQEKLELMQIYHQNDLKKEQELNEKYNLDNIFNKKAHDNSNKVQEARMIEYKQSFLQRIFNRIKRIFKIIK